MERLQRILASRGVASRRAAEDLIREGRVKVNGHVVTELGTKANPATDEIRVDNQILRQQPLRYLILNKPTGYITTTNDERGRWTVMDLIRVPERVFPVGRLDRSTEGLLIFTNDGDVANRIMHPRYGLAKEYHVLTRARPTTQQTNRIRGGVVIEGKRIVPEEFRLLRETSEGFTLTITVHEGMYHLVRRIMEIAGIEVLRLRRARIGPISIQGLSLGEWRDLTTGEQNILFEALHIDDETIARNAERPIKVRPTGSHGPANPLWKKPKRPEDKPEPKPNVPYYKKPSRTEREAAEQSRAIADQSPQSENEQYDKPKRGTDKRQRTDRTNEPQRDRNRRTSRKRKDDPRGSPR
jgi:23S rRNA pseudouridine2605 synthase